MVATADISALAFMAINAILFIFQQAARAGVATARARPSSQADPALIRPRSPRSCLRWIHFDGDKVLAALNQVGSWL